MKKLRHAFGIKKNKDTATGNEAVSRPTRERTLSLDGLQQKLQAVQSALNDKLIPGTQKIEMLAIADAALKKLSEAHQHQLGALSISDEDSLQAALDKVSTLIQSPAAAITTADAETEAHTSTSGSSDDAGPAATTGITAQYGARPGNRTNDTLSLDQLHAFLKPLADDKKWKKTNSAAQLCTAINNKINALSPEDRAGLETQSVSNKTEFNALVQALDRLAQSAQTIPATQAQSALSQAGGTYGTAPSLSAATAAASATPTPSHYGNMPSTDPQRPVSRGITGYGVMPPITGGGAAGAAQSAGGASGAGSTEAGADNAAHSPTVLQDTSGYGAVPRGHVGADNAAHSPTVLQDTSGYGAVPRGHVGAATGKPLGANRASTFAKNAQAGATSESAQRYAQTPSGLRPGQQSPTYGQVPGKMQPPSTYGQVPGEMQRGRQDPQRQGTPAPSSTNADTDADATTPAPPPPAAKRS